MPAMPRISLSLVTVSSKADAERLSRALVEEGLAACVSHLAGVRSIYRWKGRVEEAEEVQLFIKHAAANTSALQRRVRELHGAEVPELIHFDASGGLEPYLAWVERGGENEKSPPTS